MARRYLIDVPGGEEEFHIVVGKLPPDVTPITDYHGPFLPRYLLTFGDEGNLKRSAIYRKNYKGATMFRIKVKVLIKPGDPTKHMRDAELWAIGLNNANAAKKWYYLDTKKTFPAVVGAQGWVRDKNNWDAIIELASLPVPAVS